MKTAEEIIKDQFGISIDAKDLTPMDKGECMKCMIEFAKMHVTEALKQVSESADVFYGDCGESYNTVDKQSILNAYPLDKIK